MDSLKLHGSQKVARSMSMEQESILQKSILERMPGELFLTVADNLDIVSRLCLKNTNQYFYASIKRPKLSLCAKLEFIHYLNLDRAPDSKMDLPSGTQASSHCPGYTKTAFSIRSYCAACRVNGPMEYCLECGVRTYYRRHISLWKKRMDDEKEKKEREAAEALLAVQKKKQTHGNTEGKKRRKTKASSAQKKHIFEDEPVLRLRSGASNMEEIYFKHRVERCSRDPSRKGWRT